jgi:hypothetical protein
VSDLLKIDNIICIIDQCNQDKIESNIIIWKIKYVILSGQRMLTQSTTYVVHSIHFIIKKFTLQFFYLLLMEKHALFFKTPMLWNNSFMILQMLNVNML